MLFWSKRCQTHPRTLDNGERSFASAQERQSEEMDTQTTTIHSERDRQRGPRSREEEDDTLERSRDNHPPTTSEESAWFIHEETPLESPLHLASYCLAQALGA